MNYDISEINKMFRRTGDDGRYFKWQLKEDITQIQVDSKAATYSGYTITESNDLEDIVDLIKSIIKEYKERGNSVKVFEDKVVFEYENTVMKEHVELTVHKLVNIFSLGIMEEE